MSFFYPDNKTDLRNMGILDLGLRMLQSSGPQPTGMGFGARLGQAGVAGMQDLRGMAGQYAQMQALQQKNELARAQQQARIDQANRFMDNVKQYGPLSSQQNVAADLGYNAILSGKNVPEFSTKTLWPKSDAQEIARREKAVEVLKGYVQKTMPEGSQRDALMGIAENNILGGKQVPAGVMAALMPSTKTASNKFTMADRKMELAKKIANKTATPQEIDEFDLLIQADPLDRLRREISKNFNKSSEEKVNPSFGERLDKWFSGH